MFTSIRELLRRPSVGIACVAGCVAVAVCYFGEMVRGARERNAAPGLYLIALDAGARVGLGWRTVGVETSLTLPQGSEAQIPAGSRFRVIKAADGTVVTVTGPAILRAGVGAVPAEPDVLRSRLRALVSLPEAGAGVSGGAIAITSPAGVTRFTNPLINWVAREGVLYDVAVVDSGDRMAPARIATGVRPPVALAKLETTLRRSLPPDRLHEVLVRESGSELVLGLARFLTASDANGAEFPVAPAELLLEAAMACAQKPQRTGDAWLALSRLPVEWGATELAVRLRLSVSTQLGLADEIERARRAVEIRTGR